MSSRKAVAAWQEPPVTVALLRDHRRIGSTCEMKEGEEWWKHTGGEEKKEKKEEQTKKRPAPTSAAATPAITTAATSSTSSPSSSSSAIVPPTAQQKSDSNSEVIEQTKKKHRKHSPEKKAKAASSEASTSLVPPASSPSSASTSSAVSSPHIPVWERFQVTKSGKDGSSVKISDDDPRIYSDRILEQYFTAAAKGELLNPNTKPVGSDSPFIQRLMMAYGHVEKRGQLTREMVEPYREYMRQLIRCIDLKQKYQVHVRDIEESRTYNFQHSSIKCTLLQYVIYHFSINTRHHIAYDWLCDILSIKGYPIDQADADGETALSSWCKDAHIRNGLVFHELVRAGADIKLMQKGKNFLDHITSYLGEPGRKPDRLLSLLSHEYAFLFYDALFLMRLTIHRWDPSEIRLVNALPWRFALHPIPDHQIDESDFGQMRWESEELVEMMAFDRQKLIRCMLKRWITQGRPQLRDAIMQTTNMAVVCADLCIDYYDGSSREDVAAVVALPHPLESPTAEASAIASAASSSSSSSSY